jgi:4-amino-4-deoxy-L-arabinose transferase-like glycosyltransferase
MGIGIILSLISIALLGEQKGPVVIQAVPLLAGIWVFFDAARRRLPRPFRWAMGTVLLLAVVFPWYLARRNKPESPVPFIEAETGRTTRILLIALLVFFLISVIVNVWQNQQPGSKPDSTPKIQPSSGGSTSRITSLRPMGGNAPSRLLRQNAGWVLDGSDRRTGYDSLANDHQA